MSTRSGQTLLGTWASGLPLVRIHDVLVVLHKIIHRLATKVSVRRGGDRSRKASVEESE